VRAFHIEDAEGIDPALGEISHQMVGTKEQRVDRDWLGGAAVIGITAGASTPNNKVGETIARICETAGLEDELRTLTA